MPKSVSVVLPTYNELSNIIPLVKAIAEVLDGRDYEILVVDDNSPDGTYQAIVDLAEPRIRGILRTSDRGFAKSIRCGLENARGDYLVVMDSDFNHQPRYLPFMLDSLKHYECVSGSRFVYGGAMDTRRRHLLSWVFNIFSRLVTGGQITDSLYGFLAMRRELLAGLDFDKIFFGYGDYCIRLMYYLQQDRREVLQFPAVNGRRLAGTGNTHLFRVGILYTKAVLRLGRERLFPQ